MLIAQSHYRPSSFARRTAALAFVACASTLTLHAQQASGGDAPAPAAPLVSFNANAPLDLATAAGVGYDSSSSSSSVVEASSLNFTGVSGAALQPPPRRRYGRPRYNDSSHNPDGSNKYAFVAALGITLPTGNTYHYLNPDYGFQLGFGRNFDKNFAIVAQFDYDHFGFTGNTIRNQSVLYSAQGSLDGKSHVWSLTLNPTYTFTSSEGLGGYIVGGVGFYHKTANFTVPATGTYCDPYYGCYQYAANQTIDKYTSNAPGFSGGFGITFKPSRFAGERLFVEARYVYIDNRQRVGITIQNQGTTFGQTYNGSNFYPANSNRTSYVPIKAGIRF